jgi:alkanesulfonate monooxygenase SsuD/methylene tetrahydromethanopterin reductase-like flavin-dependent oxidoreductase (luciferase family)
MAEVKFGWRVPAFPFDNSRRSTFIDQINKTMEKVEGRFDSAWVADHFIPWATMVSDEVDTLECMTTISYLAGAFPGLKFGSIVLCQSYRNPALLAKMGATLQILTGGRFIFGIGAGWKQDEYLAYDYEFPKAAARIGQLAETVKIVRKLWTEAPATFEGKYYSIKNAYCEPRPDPLPPIMIGGGGEQLTLRVVAEQADWWNIPGGTLENYARKLEVLRSHCEAVGRNYDEIVKTWGHEALTIAETEAEARRIAERNPLNSPTAIVGTPDQVVGRLQSFIDLGVEYFVLRFADFPNTAGIELFMEQVMPRLSSTQEGS